MNDNLLRAASTLEFFENQTANFLKGMECMNALLNEAKKNVDENGNIRYCYRCGSIIGIGRYDCPECKFACDIMETNLEDHFKTLLKLIVEKKTLFDNMFDEVEKYRKEMSTRENGV